MEKTEEKSQEQAEIIKMIAFGVVQLDLEYCREIAADFLKQASRQESMAVLNPHHPQSKNDLLRAKGRALHKLCDYVDALKEVDKIKEKVSGEEQQNAKIAKLFM